LNRILLVSDSFSVHHQESSTVDTTIGIWHTGLADYLLASSDQNLRAKPAEKQFETCRVLFQK